MYMVMRGVVCCYLRLKNGEEIITDYLGIGSIIGQYSMLDKEIMVIGFKVISYDGALLV